MELDLARPGRRPVTVFTPHRDAVAEARFVLLSPRHPEVERWVGDDAVRAQLDELRSGGWERSARDAAAVPVIDTGASLAAPGGAELPVFVSPIVDARYGPTAALGIPAVDEADATIAARMPRVAAPRAPAGRRGARRPGAGRPAREAKRYRANDFSICRQRSWGTPIPAIR